MPSSFIEFQLTRDSAFPINAPNNKRAPETKTKTTRSYSIGLGNVIRFPILVQKNGGLAFIIPFVSMLLLEGIPLFYLELAIGQRMRKAAISCWQAVSPFAAGIGLASAAVSFLIGLYYNTMVAWTLIYTWSALTNDQQANSKAPPPECAELADNDNDLAPMAADTGNGTLSQAASECQLAGPFEYRWYRKTLDVTEDVSDWSHFNKPVALCLALAWLLSYVCLVRGLSSSKRLVYIISIFPYVILVIFLFKAINLPGMGHGLRYFFEPDVSASEFLVLIQQVPISIQPPNSNHKPPPNPAAKPSASGLSCSTRLSGSRRLRRSSSHSASALAA